MSGNHDRNRKADVWLVGLVVAAVVFLAIVVSFAVLEHPKHCDQPEEDVTDVLPGQSWDAIKVTAPSFSDGKYAYRLTNRANGASGSMVQMMDSDGVLRWHYLPEEDAR